MISFTALLEKFDQKGEKTGWTYFVVPTDVSDALQPGVKTSFRVKGFLDQHPIRAVALIPMGESGGTDGAFILPVNAAMRQALRKRDGATVAVQVAVDDARLPQSADLLACLADEPRAQAYFNSLAPSHQHYFTKWIEAAKTPGTKAKRIAQAINGMARGLNYAEVLRAGRT